MCEKVETFINHEAVLQFPINETQPGKEKWKILWTTENESSISSRIWEKICENIKRLR